jgi:hypothetical protein
MLLILRLLASDGIFANHNQSLSRFAIRIASDAALDAKNYFDLSSRPIPPFVRNQFGARFGGPLVHDRTFFFANYEGFREVQAFTAIATVPDALAHQGLLPSASNPSACTSATPVGCFAVGVDPRVQPFLALLPPSNGEIAGTEPAT